MGRATGKYSVTLPEDIVEEVRARSWSSGLSAYVAETVRHQIEQDRLAELLAAMEAEHGVVTDERINAVPDRIHQAHVEQGVRSAPPPGGTGAA
ncbi:hypothetical protein [Nocardiopsis sp. FIRDI 009]|uniref:hypothetical protein n=1 Tax=Nocardiopsis sp. FIRDI 009 TaxID=714197 RepID=UPI000E24E8FB|nr:hypothetical protein [Nocardiopsis sp. FIRDI 009]